ncbi:MAG TPA: oligosaccharide flippase family protein [Acidisarcina sp.]
MHSVLIRVRGHDISRNAGWILTGQVIGFVLQVAFFILLARFLRVSEYGRFAGAVALTTTLMPYSSLGSSMLFMRYVTADPATAQTYWGNCLAVITLMTVMIAGAFYLLGPLLRVSSDPLLVLVLVISNCLCAQVVLCASAVFQTLNKFRITAILRLLPNLLRLIVLLVMRPAVHHASALQWSIGVLGSALLAAALSIAFVRQAIGPARIDLRLARKRLGEGGGYSFAGSTQSAYNDIDKAMLSRYGMNEQNGIYTLAYRVIDIACTPVQAIDAAALPRYFGDHKSSFRAVLRLANRLIPAAAGTGLLMGLCALLASSEIPRMAGRDFSEVVAAIRWLSLLPMLRGLHQLAGGAITGAGFQRYRTAGQVAVALSNIGLNLWLIPGFGWHGAAWSSLASDGGLAVINISVLLWLRRVLLKHEAPSLITSRRAIV